MQKVQNPKKFTPRHKVKNSMPNPKSNQTLHDTQQTSNNAKWKAYLNHVQGMEIAWKS